MRESLKVIYLMLRRAFLGSADALFGPRAASLSSAPRKVLLIRTDRLGDMTLTTAVFKSLKAKFPEASLTVLAAPAAGALISADPRLARVVLWEGGILEKVRIILGLRHAKYDIAIDPLNGYELKTALLAFLSGAPLRLGYVSHGRELLFNIRVSPPAERIHFIREATLLLEAIGVEAAEIWPELFVSDEAENASAELFRSSGLLPEDFVVSVHPGGHYPSQRWPIERFSEVVRWLAERYAAKFILIAKSSEEGLVKMLASSLPSSTKILKASDIRPDILCALMRRSKLFIGNNSGPLHIAAALGIPSVSVMGPADPVKWSPYGPDNTVLRSGRSCSPCNKGVCAGHECMTDITPDDMKAAIAAFSAKKGWRVMENLK